MARILSLIQLSRTGNVGYLNVCEMYVQLFGFR
jgi:hypothetical protein